MMGVFMRHRSQSVAGIVWPAMLAALALLVRLTAQTGAEQAAGLKIVVIEGEAAVNIIQQKTAVSPVIEVRDRNDQPVAGAVVRFAIQGGRATFNGARTLTVTTNVAGRAAVTGLTPTTSGAVQISASAAFQGQTAVVTIAQTNVLTAVQAAQAATAAGAGGSGGGASAGGAAAGAGGGSLSATTIGLVGAAVGGGALAATQLIGDKAEGGGTKYTGTYSGQLVQILGSGSPPGGCTSTSALTGTLEVKLETATGGAASGTAQVDHHNAEIANLCLGSLQTPYNFRTPPSPVAGATSNLEFSYASSGTYVNPNGSGATGTFTHAFTFSGALNENAIMGVLTITYTNQPSGGPGSGPGGGGSTSFPMTLR